MRRCGVVASQRRRRPTNLLAPQQTLPGPGTTSRPGPPPFLPLLLRHWHRGGRARAGYGIGAKHAPGVRPTAPCRARRAARACMAPDRGPPCSSCSQPWGGQPGRFASHSSAISLIFFHRNRPTVRPSGQQTCPPPDTAAPAPPPRYRPARASPASAATPSLQLAVPWRDIHDARPRRRAAPGAAARGVRIPSPRAAGRRPRSLPDSPLRAAARDSLRRAGDGHPGLPGEAHSRAARGAAGSPSAAARGPSDRTTPRSCTI